MKLVGVNIKHFVLSSRGSGLLILEQVSLRPHSDYLLYNDFQPKVHLHCSYLNTSLDFDALQIQALCFALHATHVLLACFLCEYVCCTHVVVPWCQKQGMVHVELCQAMPVGHGKEKIHHSRVVGHINKDFKNWYSTLRMV